jgi:hypothetical protein
MWVFINYCLFKKDCRKWFLQSMIESWDCGRMPNRSRVQAQAEVQAQAQAQAQAEDTL